MTSTSSIVQTAQIIVDNLTNDKVTDRLMQIWLLQNTSSQEILETTVNILAKMPNTPETPAKLFRLQSVVDYTYLGHNNVEKMYYAVIDKDNALFCAVAKKMHKELNSIAESNGWVYI